MRLLFVTHTLPPLNRPLDNIGGMQRGALELYRTLGVHPRVQLTPVTLQTSTKWEEVQTALFLARALADLPLRARRAQADVVFFTSPVTASLLPLLRPRLGGRPVACVTHGLDVTLPSAPYQRLVRYLLPRLDAIFPLSSATAAECLARGARPEQTHVVPFGVDVHRFDDAPDHATARRALNERLGLPHDSFLLVSVGRMVKRKGTAWFVEHVMPRLPASVHFAAAGDGPELERVRELSRPVADRVHFVGRVPEDDLTTLLCGGDLFVMPNVRVPGDMEGQGLVLLEAALCGRPAVAAALEGILDVVTEGANGHLVPTEDAAGFAEVITRYATDRAALAAFSERARAHIRHAFAWSSIGDRYVSVLEELASRSARR